MLDAPTSLRAPFNAAAEKVVNFDEYRFKKQDMLWDQSTLGERLFEAFVNFPHSMMLFVRRGFGEAYDFLKNKKEPVGTMYTDTLSGDLYLDRTCVKSDIDYAVKHGLGAKFQAKAARVAQQAFDECRDFSMLVKTGQLKPVIR